MPKLFMIKETFDYDERELIPELEDKYIELIKKNIVNSELYIFGNYDKGFWDEVVMSKPKEIILDPMDEFPIILIEKISHFASLSFDFLPEREFYYGNSNLKLEEFTKLMLSKSIKKYKELKN